MADIKIDKLNKFYGNVQVIKDVSLEIKSQSFTVLVGPSGCGKSTMLRMIAGLEDINSGTISIGGTVVNDLPPKERNIAMVFQSYALYPHMTVFDNMAFGLKLEKKSKLEIEKRVKEAARILQIENLLDRKPKQLSGGQRQRVAIGRAITRNQKVFLFDEPLSNLDAALRVATRIEIANLHDSMPDATMVYVTHDQVEAMTLANQIVVLSEGQIEQIGSPLELYEEPENLFVAKFIGSPAMNIIPIEIFNLPYLAEINFFVAKIDNTKYSLRNFDLNDSLATFEYTKNVNVWLQRTILCDNYDDAVNGNIEMNLQLMQFINSTQGCAPVCEENGVFLNAVCASYNWQDGYVMLF